jgi:AraC family transcriptional regulator
MDATATSSVDHVVGVSLTTRLAVSEIRQYSWDRAIDSTIVCDDVHMVDLCLTPRPQGARARFADRWTRNRFERIGGMFLLPAGFVTQARANAGRQKSVVTFLNAQVLSEWLEADQEDWSDRRLSSSLDIYAPEMRNILVRLALELECPGFACETMIDLLNMQLALELGRFLRSVPEVAVGGLAPWRLKLIDERIAEGPDPPTLTELAALVALSVRHLTRGFRDSRGVSIGAYIEAKRIAEARRQLEGETSIKEIAHRMGFASQSAFSYAFRTRAGESPQAYRRRMRS